MSQYKAFYVDFRNLHSKDLEDFLGVRLIGFLMDSDINDSYIMFDTKYYTHRVYHNQYIVVSMEDRNRIENFAAREFHAKFNTYREYGTFVYCNLKNEKKSTVYATLDEWHPDINGSCTPIIYSTNPAFKDEEEFFIWCRQHGGTWYEVEGKNDL